MGRSCEENWNLHILYTARTSRVHRLQTLLQKRHQTTVDAYAHARRSAQPETATALHSVSIVSDSVRYDVGMAAPTNNIPTIFVAFGATGDLMRRKVLPALFYCHR